MDSSVVKKSKIRNLSSVTAIILYVLVAVCVSEGEKEREGESVKDR